MVYKAASKLDFELLLEVQKRVEANYLDGKPRHFHPSAREIDFDPMNPGPSVFYIVSAEDFVNFSDEQISKILKHRNIVIQTPVGSKVTEFGIGTLRALRHCRDNLVMQGESAHKTLYLASAYPLYRPVSKNRRGSQRDTRQGQFIGAFCGSKEGGRSSFGCARHILWIPDGFPTSILVSDIVWTS